MKLIKSVAFIAVSGCLLVSGCASVIQGTKQRVSVETDPVDGAHCVLQNKAGSWAVASTPDQALVHRSGSPLTVTCQKKGYRKSTRTFDAAAGGQVLGNLIAGGIIGAGVDAASGAAYSYPSTINIPMRKG